MLAAVYARYSSSRQRESSIEDQQRNCATRAAQEGLTVVEQYADRRITGARADRPGYQRMLAAAMSGQFQVLLVDDLSRLSRDAVETESTIRRLEFQNIRVIGVSDGYDSTQSSRKLNRGMRGLINEVYLDDLREKTHRGLTGRALAKLSAGGRPYGYRSISRAEGVQWEPDPDTAPVVVGIFERYVNGKSPRAIAAELNARGIPSPRGGTWAYTAINPTDKGGILANEVYLGRVVWNRTRWVKDPDTGIRKRLERPQSDWIVYEDDSLRIVPQTLWAAAQTRWAQVRHERNESTGKATGHKSYPLSGLLYCATCGGRLVMLNATSYGCATHKNRGTCPERRTIRREYLELSMMRALADEILSPAGIERFVERIKRQWEEASKGADTAELERTLRKTQGTIDNIVGAIAAGTFSPSLQQALEQAERQKVEIEGELERVKRATRLPELDRGQIERVFVDTITRLPEILRADPDQARETFRHLTGGRIVLVWDGEGPKAEFHLTYPAFGLETVGSGGPLCSVSILPRVA